VPARPRSPAPERPTPGSAICPPCRTRTREAAAGASRSSARGTLNGMSRCPRSSDTRSCTPCRRGDRAARPAKINPARGDVFPGRIERGFGRPRMLSVPLRASPCSSGASARNPAALAMPIQRSAAFIGRHRPGAGRRRRLGRRVARARRRCSTAHSSTVRGVELVAGIRPI
jgi:hypothetical protein